MAISASPEIQEKLLEVQALDTRLLQLNHKRSSLPEHKQVQDLEVQLGSLEIQIVAAQTQISDLKVAVRKAENDVEQVVMRATKDREKLDSGAITSSKDLENLQKEIESLSIRQSELEEVELEILEKVEEAETLLQELLQVQASASEDHQSVTAKLSNELADIDGDISEITTQRNALTVGLPKDLLDLYDKLRTDLGGVGAAHLHRAQCQGCHIALDAGELSRIRSLTPDAVVRCDQCRRILVRTADSGL